jgi:hypothetical protein
MRVECQGLVSRIRPGNRSTHLRPDDRRVDSLDINLVNNRSIDMICPASSAPGLLQPGQAQSIIKKKRNFQKETDMQNREISDPVSLIIKDCHQSEEDANRIFHQLAEERQHHYTLGNGKRVHLSNQQLEEFAARFSSEVEPTYWVSRRLKD